MCFIVVNADMYDYQLISDLFANYSRVARPSVNHSQTTNVYLGLMLSQILDVVSKRKAK